MSTGAAVTSVEPQDVSVFTVCNVAYLSKALVLAESLYATTKVRLKIFIFDQERLISTFGVPCDIIWIENIDFSDLRKLAFKYDVTEFTTALKPTLALRLLEASSKVVFLDPDVFVTDNLRTIFDELGNSPIVLTPHYTTPQSIDEADSDIGMMRFGSYNLGFFGVASSEEGRSFLKWWESRCLKMCYFETQFGLSTDQKWVSIAPCFFPNLKTLFNHGYNVAFWNLHERKISKRDGRYFVNNVSPLVFFHFSSFNEKNPRLLTTRPVSPALIEGSGIEDLVLIYSEKLAQYKPCANDKKYSYETFSNGKYVSPTLRRAYASVVDSLIAHADPFDSTGIVYKFAKKNNLITESNVAFSPARFSDYKDNHRKFLLIFAILRFVLRLIGPNRFFNLSTLFVFLSSYRLTRDMWKVERAWAKSSL
jgi:hypothetical protein